jgi:histidinol phosphatase-like enzyme (inositol monophosphatase family)
MIEPAELEDLLAFALDAARAAGRLTLARFGGIQAFDLKPDRSPVTAADREAEEFLRGRLADHCPRDGVIGEEYGVVEGESGRRWTVDPIDGTRAYARGVPLYGVLMGLLDGDEAVLGIVHLPALHETVAAARGLGCEWYRPSAPPVPARVSAIAPLAEGLVLSTDFARLDPDDPGRPYGQLVRAAGLVRTWGDCWGHVLVATGRAEAMIDPKMSPWDSVPLQPIVEEAGGRFTTLAGEAAPDGGSAVSTNGLVHDELLGVLDSVARRA